jgi:hypothetical protein
VDFTAAAARLGHLAPRDESGLVDRPGIVSPALCTGATGLRAYCPGLLPGGGGRSDALHTS